MEGSSLSTRRPDDQALSFDDFLTGGEIGIARIGLILRAIRG
jgi:hypothetical protein